MATNKFLASEEIPQARANIATALKELLARHGVPAAEHHTRLAEITDLDYQAVRRRMIGKVPWAPGELLMIGRRFNESALELYAAVLMYGPGRPAYLDVEGLKIKCAVWPGEPFSPSVHKVPRLVCLPPPEGGEAWAVIPSERAAGRTAYLVRGLVHDALTALVRVALLGPVPGPLVQLMESQAIPFYEFPTARALLKTLHQDHFDAYVIDWTTIAKDPKGVLQTIRERSPQAPIVVTIKDNDAGDPTVQAAADAARAVLHDRRSASLIFHSVISRMRLT